VLWPLRCWLWCSRTFFSIPFICSINFVDKRDILGIGFSNLSATELFDHLDYGIEAEVKRQLCFVPTNSILAARKDEAVMRAYQQADVVMCDGVPVYWASKFLNRPLKQRYTGFDFFPQFIAHAADKGYSIFLMGAMPGVADDLQKMYKAKYPGLKITDVYSPPFSKAFSEEENNAMINMINASGTDVLFVSLTAPKQDLWIHQHLQQLNIKLAIGIGAAFDAENGKIKRAPLLMQRMGLEWFFRFLQEPRRLFRRYFLEAPVFILLVLKEKLSSKS
jgi:N-acetylglucosaminyldiphosphoundecaprenol N-acetyl-beta-D-mannosaminyltransferase